MTTVTMVRQLRRGRSGRGDARLPGAGTVLRCPHRDNALLKIVEGGTRIWMDFGGMQTLEIPPLAALGEAPWVGCGAAPGLADCLGGSVAGRCCREGGRTMPTWRGST